MKFILTDNDFIVKNPDKSKAQTYLDTYGMYDGLEPKDKESLFKFLPYVVQWGKEKDGKKIYEEIQRRIKLSVQDIKAAHPELKPKFIPALPVASLSSPEREK